MKKILCFGDSNTYGYIPQSGKRYDKNTRWTGVLQNLSGEEYSVIEAGCNNRTCFCDNPDGVIFTGYKCISQYLTEDLDYIILFIGINDTQFVYDASLAELQSGLENLLNLIYSKVPQVKVVLLAPPRLNENILNTHFSFMFDKTSIEKSSRLAEIYKNVALKFNCDFIDLNKIIEVSKKDGLHLEPDAHKKIAENVYEKL